MPPLFFFFSFFFCETGSPVLPRLSSNLVIFLPPKCLIMIVYFWFVLTFWWTVMTRMFSLLEVRYWQTKREKDFTLRWRVRKRKGRWSKGMDGGWYPTERRKEGDKGCRRVRLLTTSPFLFHAVKIGCFFFLFLWRSHERTEKEADLLLKVSTPASRF